jgi:hypothetical protein
MKFFVRNNLLLGLFIDGRLVNIFINHLNADNNTASAAFVFTFGEIGFFRKIIFNKIS